MIRLCLMDIRKFNDKKLLEEALNNASLVRKKKYESFHNDEVRLQSIAATYIIDKYLERLGLREKDMVYGFGKAGKPYFENHKEIFFNISHSKNLAIVAFADKEIGVDIQVVRSAPQDLYDLVLSEKEKSDLLAIEDEKARGEKFFEHWVIKEAIVKRDGTGLTNDLSKVHDENAYLDKKVLMDDNETYLLSVNTGIKEEIVTISI